jgi:hypothetical protein
MTLRELPAATVRKAGDRLNPMVLDENGEAQTNTGSQPQPENDNSGFPDSEDRFNFGLAPETKDWDRIDDRTNMGVAIEPRSHISMLFCIRHLGDGVSIILAQAVEPVNQRIMQANILLIACAIITLGLSAIFVFKLSRRFTERSEGSK